MFIDLKEKETKIDTVRLQCLRSFSSSVLQNKQEVKGEKVTGEIIPSSEQEPSVEEQTKIDTQTKIDAPGDKKL